ncbi:hypothetical protein C672_3555 [[Clostridium] bifermentans ATCC 638]|uniref:Uncharacterized protein n=1 Tax=Paraclostridium bifermentans ATCC 638 = DSM 14991 TaxID=1233171 RepID=T4VH73_PARBF|nr:hypothetical protein [Paraclostridium bifermentans]EQK40027.1 hypothetical protein C672_3555 [[Clostridium] bifermentans ATCC 638] [Paraclostridium bifermentans ATCC 638 = DSM 14991]RIZ57481.1 hypothetical protein CHH45_15930 [Paraclostridium bifermentans]UAG19946.1 hypothetical protein KXZ80_17230 [Paraclostridium bifermentans]
MQFDAIKVKNSSSKSKSRKNKKIEKEINKINKVYPIVGVTDEGYIKTKIGLYEAVFEIFDVRKYDLFLLDNSEIDFVTENNWRMQKLYPYPLKEVYMNFQEENKEQQKYFKYKIDNTESISQLEVLNNELEKLKFIEKTYEMRDTYLFVFGDNVSDLNKKIDILYRFDNFLELKKTSVEKKKKIIDKLNNRD